MTIIRAAVLVLACLTVLGVALEQWSRLRAPRLYPPLGELIDIGGRRIHLRCVGEGSPVVIFEAGGGLPSVAWKMTQPRVAEMTMACAYDRAGTGWSDRAAGPRGSDQLIGDLRAVLAKASVAPPYVLVGHSFGGPIIAAYANRHPEDVAGLVFVDPTAPEFALSQIEDSGIADRIRMIAMRVAAETGLARLWLSRSRHTEYAKLFASRDLTAMLRELRDSNGLLMEAAGIESFGDRPVIVLTGGSTAPRGMRAEEIQRILDRLLAEHSELARRSTRGEHRVVDAGHMIQMEQPAAVTQAILQVVETVRSDSATGELRPLG